MYTNSAAAGSFCDHLSAITSFSWYLFFIRGGGAFIYLDVIFHFCPNVQTVKARQFKLVLYKILKDTVF